MKKLFQFILFFTCLSAAAQKDDTTTHYKKSGRSYTRMDYVENMTGYIQVTPFIYSSRNHFELKDERILTFEPNEGAGIGVRLQHRWLGFAVSYVPRNLQADIKGKTDYINLQLNSYGKKVGFDIYYTTYDGYYLENYRKFPELDSAYGKNFPVRPDIATIAVGTNVYYIFNSKKYSFRSSFIQNERQKKSAGSFMLNTGISYYGIRGDSTIIPPEIRRFYEPTAQFKKGEFYSFSLTPGYAHTFVAWQRFYLTLSVFAGVNMQYQSYDAGRNGYTERIVFLPRGFSKTGLGYNGKKFYAGFTSLVDTYNLPLGKRSQMSYIIGSGTVFFGMRLGVPQSLRKYSDWMGSFDPLVIFNKH